MGGGRVLVRLGAGFASAVVVGVVGGVLARVLMRLATVAAGVEGSFSWAGSLIIVFFFAAIMMPGAVFAAFTRRRRGLIPLMLCSGLLCVMGAGIAIQDLSAVNNRAIPSTFEWILVGGTAVGILATVLAMPALIARLLRRVRQST
ncbi:hypothetical protein [Nonomuraea turcica]|uniref:hypothetical protein n=1 Tax=Nonomuraea sp. G32 TaxID=3067274 RepID=UPI00273A8854|nr:hypothetical protein [Nonomuraea sp. G32]MDP4510513.1 hypothetical protein [Nonomuraea sp. G32]